MILTIITGFLILVGSVFEMEEEAPELSMNNGIFNRHGISFDVMNSSQQNFSLESFQLGLLQDCCTVHKIEKIENKQWEYILRPIRDNHSIVRVVILPQYILDDYLQDSKLGKFMLWLKDNKCSACIKFTVTYRMGTSSELKEKSISLRRVHKDNKFNAEGKDGNAIQLVL